MLAKFQKKCLKVLISNISCAYKKDNLLPKYYLFISDSFKRMKSSDGLYYVIVIENILSERVIASATLLIEQKFIHACGLVRFV